MMKATCPDCGADVFSLNPQVGQSLRCKECDMQLEVIDDDPFEVDYFGFDDWESDDDDDDDEEEDE